MTITGLAHKISDSPANDNASSTGISGPEGCSLNQFLERRVRIGKALDVGCGTSLDELASLDIILDHVEGIAWEVRQATLRTNNTGTACKGITCGGR